MKVPMSAPKSDPDAAILPSQTYRSAAVVGRKPLHFAFTPDAAARAAIAAHLGLLGLHSFVLKGAFTPQGRGDVVLRADLSAAITQACTITLAPVPAKISSTIARDYLREFAEPTALEAELGPEDQEPLPEEFDVAAIAIEELALSLPLYPRAAGASLAPTIAAPAGSAPLTDDALRPFAGLASLAQAMSAAPKDKLGDGPDTGHVDEDAQNKEDPPK
jgi:uncharacterized metal-binding protein YceD (DUF177 family)